MRRKQNSIQNRNTVLNPFKGFPKTPINKKQTSRKKKSPSNKIDNSEINLRNLLYKKKSCVINENHHIRTNTAINIVKKLKEKIKKNVDFLKPKLKSRKIKIVDQMSIPINNLQNEKLKFLKFPRLKSVNIVNIPKQKQKREKEKEKPLKKSKKIDIKIESETKKNNNNIDMKKRINFLIKNLKIHSNRNSKHNYPISFSKLNDSDYKSNRALLPKCKKPKFHFYKNIETNLSEEIQKKKNISDSLQRYFFNRFQDSVKYSKIDAKNYSSCSKKSKKIDSNQPKKNAIVQKKNKSKIRKKNFTNTSDYLTNLIKDEKLIIEYKNSINEDDSSDSIKFNSEKSSKKVYEKSGSSTPQNQSNIKSHQNSNMDNIYRLYSEQNIPRNFKLENISINTSLVYPKSKKDLLIERIKYSMKNQTEIKTNLDFYDFHEILGEGSYAKVYLATSVLTSKKVAIKCYEQSKIKEKKTKKRIIQEIDILKSIKNSNIIKIYETFENEEYLFIVLEYINNGELLNYLQNHGTFSEFGFLKIFKQILNSLNYLKSFNILHRDIKLDNILLTSENVVKLCDFGISRRMRKNTQIFEHIGTPAYLAPEIILKRGYSGFSSDIWSLGVLSYIVLTGMVPFKGETIEELDFQILNNEVDLNKFGFLSEKMKIVLEGMLIKNPLLRINLQDISKLLGIELEMVKFDEKKENETNFDKIKILKKFGFDEKYLIDNLIKNEFNHSTFLYKII